MKFQPEPKCESNIVVNSNDGGVLCLHAHVLKSKSTVFRAMDFKGEDSTFDLENTFADLQAFFKAFYSCCATKEITLGNVAAVTRLAFKYDVKVFTRCSLVVLFTH